MGRLSGILYTILREENMWLTKIIPNKFGSRLFLMTFIARLVPIAIFTLLLKNYGREF
jgi:hypothetical protein